MVVTCSHEPYPWIVQAVESVLAQTCATRPIVVGDGPLAADGDDTQFAALMRQCDRISASVPHEDAGDWARTSGALHAAALGYDAVGFLDGDNWLERDHVEKLMALDRSFDDLNAWIATSARFICHEDGRVLGTDSECDGAGHVDTSCFLFRQRAFGLLPHWALIPRAVAPICDRIFWTYAKAVIKDGILTHAHSAAPTVNFRSRYACHYRDAGMEPPPGSKVDIRLPASDYHLPWPFSQEIVVQERPTTDAAR